MGLQPGELIDDKYRIVRLIGEGGMGAVYEGENTRIHRRVAIKVLHAGVSEMPDVVARFEREAQAAGRIGSEHIVEVLDLGTLRGGDRYMVMEFMDGDSLAQRIRQRGSMAPKDLYPVARQLLDALAAAHNAGIVHRDLKPDNVFLLKSRRGQPDFLKLLDFGISKFSSGPGGLSMTRTGAVMGTPYYMAPEQAKGAKDIDHRVDLYAAGVILYEALAGRVPFLADTFNELLFKIVLEKPEPLAKVAPHVDPVLAGIVETAMAREPGERFQTAEALRDALDHWASQQGHQASAAAAPATSGVAPVPAVAQPMAATGANNMLGSTPGNWAGASTVEGVVPPPPKSNVGLIAAVAAAVVLLGGGGVVLLTRGSHEPATAASASG
ncbi:MAG TPA: serine/threonine-protein kinase, partial [Polyangiaceae bacterium]|nr:serine/threonine-protein kinase [Polyangiaceae bacterium]